MQVFDEMALSNGVELREVDKNRTDGLAAADADRNPAVAHRCLGSSPGGRTKDSPPRGRGGALYIRRRISAVTDPAFRSKAKTPVMDLSLPDRVQPEYEMESPHAEGSTKVNVSSAKIYANARVISTCQQLYKLAR